MTFTSLSWFKKKAKVSPKINKKLYYSVIETSDINSETKKDLYIVIPMLYSSGQDHVLEMLTTCKVSSKHIPEYITRLNVEEIEMLKLIAQNSILVKNSACWHSPLGER